MAIVAGVDFGTASVRVSIIHSERGRVATGTASYPVLRNRDDPNFATQRHEDHCRALQLAFQGALAQGIDGRLIEALAVDATGSTVIAVDDQLQPLGDYYLWCDHRAWREAAEITAVGRKLKLAALDWCGGTYSSEWGFAKVLHWLRHNPDQRAAFHTALEHCDLITATLCGVSEPADLSRSICAMGHKWMWNRALGGLPPEDFLAAVDPLLKGMGERLGGHYRTSDQLAGRLCDEWAQRLGLKAGIPVPVGALDAHWDAVGAGCRLGDVINVIGTSTCMMAVTEEPRRIPGVSGVVPGSVHPDKVGIEAGLSAVGDLFDAIARRAGTTVASLSTGLEAFRPGQTGITRLCWDNGDRSVLVEAKLRGMTLGWRLNHSAQDELFAAIEGTGFHTRIILERLEEYGVPVARVINAGGIPPRNATLNRVYAGILGKPILIPAADTRSLGSAMFAFLAAGTFASLEEAQRALSSGYQIIEPDPADACTYDDLYGRFRELYFSLADLEQLKQAESP
jgi:L-ribulokinase